MERQEAIPARPPKGRSWNQREYGRYMEKLGKKYQRWNEKRELGVNS